MKGNPMTKTTSILLAVVLLLIVPLLAVAYILMQEPTPIEKAAEECGVKNLVGSESNGKAISFDTKGEEDYTGNDPAALRCIFDTLKIPSYVDNQIGNTSAMDETEQVRLDHYTIWWSYHPNYGLEITIFDRRK